MWKNDFLIFDNFLCGVSFNLSTPTYTINQKEYLHLTLVLIHIYWEVKLFIRKPIADVESKDLNILQISKWLTQWRPKIFVTSFIWSIPPPLDFPPSAGVEYLSLSTLVQSHLYQGWMGGCTLILLACMVQLAKSCQSFLMT